MTKNDIITIPPASMVAITLFLYFSPCNRDKFTGKCVTLRPISNNYSIIRYDETTICSSGALCTDNRFEHGEPDKL
jgi:hypothetical protein